MLKNFNYCVGSSFILQRSSQQKNSKTIFEHSATMEVVVEYPFFSSNYYESYFLFHSLP
jgi:hypothetical protein